MDNEPKTPIHIRISLHKRVKIAAATNDMRIETLVSQALEKYLDELNFSHKGSDNSRVFAEVSSEKAS